MPDTDNPEVTSILIVSCVTGKEYETDAEHHDEKLKEVHKDNETEELRKLQKYLEDLRDRKPSKDRHTGSKEVKRDEVRKDKE